MRPRVQCRPAGTITAPPPAAALATFCISCWRSQTLHGKREIYSLSAKDSTAAWRAAASVASSSGAASGVPSNSAIREPAAQPQAAAAAGPSPPSSAASRAPQNALPHPVGSTTLVPGKAGRSQACPDALSCTTAPSGPLRSATRRAPASRKGSVRRRGSRRAASGTACDGPHSMDAASASLGLNTSSRDMKACRSAAGTAAPAAANVSALTRPAWQGGNWRRHGEVEGEQDLRDSMGPGEGRRLTGMGTQECCLHHPSSHPFCAAPTVCAGRRPQLAQQRQAGVLRVHANVEVPGCLVTWGQLCKGWPQHGDQLRREWCAPDLCTAVDGWQKQSLGVSEQQG